MSFSNDVKNEMCRTDVLPCCAAAELTGALLLGNTFAPAGVRIITGRESFRNRLGQLCKVLFLDTLCFDETMTQTGKYSLSITQSDRAQDLFARLGYDAAGLLAIRINPALIETECCKRALLRGAFCSAGFVADPDRLYHLEIVTSHRRLSRDIIALLNDLDFNPKLIQRQHNEVIYFKESEYIEDFLTMCGATSASLRLMEAKIVKDVRNRTNRANNCDAANIGRTIEAAQVQCEAIIRLDDAIGIDKLPEPLAQAARLRLNNPDAPLTALCKLADPPVSRSGLNNRLGRLVEMAESIGKAYAMENGKLEMEK